MAQVNGSAPPIVIKLPPDSALTPDLIAWLDLAIQEKLASGYGRVELLVERGEVVHTYATESVRWRGGQASGQH